MIRLILNAYYWAKRIKDGTYKAHVKRQRRADLYCEIAYIKRQLHAMKRHNSEQVRALTRKMTKRADNMYKRVGELKDKLHETDI